MPITVDLGKSPFLRKLFEQACGRIRIENIIILLQARFGEAVPSDMEERLGKLPQEKLDGMIGRFAVAASIEGVMAMTRADDLRHADRRADAGQGEDRVGRPARDREGARRRRGRMLRR